MAKMSINQQRVMAKINECLALAKEKYGIETTGVDIQFNLRGHALGQMRGTTYTNRLSGDVVHREVTLRFNKRAIELGGKTLEHMIDDVVAHEVAHMVCYIDPVLGSDHDSGWRAVCIALGGTGGIRWNGNDAPEYNKTYVRPWVYKLPCGRAVPVTTTQHKHIQDGRVYRLKDGGGVISNECHYYKSTEQLEPM